jgi:hypothetical protein
LQGVLWLLAILGELFESEYLNPEVETTVKNVAAYSALRIVVREGTALFDEDKEIQ